MVFQRETTAIADAQEYIFKHAVLREVTYKSLLKRLRRIYHGLVADWLMEQAGERAGEYTGLIADHLELAGRSAEAVDYLLQAGDRARSLYAHQEATTAYLRALALLKEQGDDQRTARVLMKLGLTYHSAFDFRQARQVYEEAFTLWQRAGEVETEALRPAPHPLRVVATSPRTLDPSGANDSASTILVEALFSGLVAVTHDLDIVPDVASSWEVTEAGRRYVFHLRDDVRWSDGARVTAHDFEYAWKRLLDPALRLDGASNLYDLRGAMAFHQGASSDPEDVGVRALDDLTLEVELEGPTGYFLHLLAYNVTFPVPRHVVEAHGAAWTDAEHIVSNGPFTLQSWQDGESAVLVRNPRYQGRFAGNVQRLHVTFLAPGREREALEMYEADRLDAYSLETLAMTDMEPVQRAHAGEYVILPKHATFYVVFDVTRAPFDDRRVRLAFAYALDRDRAVEVTLGGCYFPATGGVVPPGMPGHSPGIAVPYDPQRARELLVDAGYPGGQGFPAVQMLAWPTIADHAEEVRAQWRENLELDIPLRTLEWADHLEQVIRDPPQLFWMGWMADYPDPDSFLRVGLRLHSKWRHEQYDELVERARRLTDQGERLKLYRQADRILVEEAPILPFSHGRVPMLMKPWVRRYGEGRDWKDVIIEPH
jgi:oligopeptide transport system substrate-binding protein